MKRPSDEIIEMVLADTGTEKDAQTVAKWFATQEGQEWLEKSISNDMSRMGTGDSDVYINHPVPSEKMYEQIEREIRKRRFRRSLLRVAVVLIPCVLLAGMGVRLDKRVDLFSRSEMQDIYVPNGERMQILFQDGTKAYLNSDSHIIYPEKFGFSKREIHLSGEAYFEVTHNKMRPFIVKLNDGLAVNVLGTSFNVKAYAQSESVIVALDEGKVEMTGAPKTYSLSPKQILYYNKATKLGDIVAEDTMHSSMWKQNVITFKDAPFDEVIETLSRWYDVDFDTTGINTSDYALTFTSKDTTIDAVLQDIERISLLRFKKDNRVVSVTKK